MLGHKLRDADLHHCVHVISGKSGHLCSVLVNSYSSVGAAQSLEAMMELGPGDKEDFLTQIYKALASISTLREKVSLGKLYWPLTLAVMFGGICS